ncbi:MAG: VWA domain-containing protein [Endomicrobiaceae bacterium]|jgi:Ca-activated chloride channel family protein|nr:VWA domain-containing protein [Endomicrobiaceae bacterium]
MHFASPIFFLLFPVLLIAAVYVHIRNKNRRKNLINFSQYDIVSGIKKSKKIKLYPLIKIINYLILIVFITALARPQIGEKTEDVLNQGADIIIALDISSSMEALDFEPVNRLEAAKKIAVDFVKTRTHDRVGLVFFSGLAFTQSPLTNDINSVTKLLNAAATNMSSVDGTAIGSAIVTATNRLKDSEAKSKIIILITDGANNIGEVDPITAGEIAKSLGIKIYAIGAGDPEGAYYQVMDPVSGMKLVKVEEQDLDEGTLTSISEMTGGQYFRANNTKMLINIIKEIDKLEKTEIQSLNFTSYEEVFDKFVWCLLCLLLLKILLENVFLRKLT